MSDAFSDATKPEGPDPDTDAVLIDDTPVEFEPVPSEPDPLADLGDEPDEEPDEDEPGIDPEEGTP